MDRYKWLLVEMEGRPDSTLTSPLRNIELTDWEKEHFRQTLDGEITQTIRPGTQTDTRIRLKGKGVPSRRNKNLRGDHYVTLIVQVPEKLNNEQKELLRKFDDAMKGIYKPEENEGKKKKSFKEKVEEKLKETFED